MKSVNSMKNKIESIPANMTIQEASEFWDTHSVADYPSNIVQFEYKPDERVTFIAIANDFMKQLEKKQKRAEYR
ncbi:MAG: hypothetical protein NT166_29730 [Candidatus Aminicenantes bacterium]|nr:hypothetical protein [Candidatus Aminicenantes bacterium]